MTLVYAVSLRPQMISPLRRTPCSLAGTLLRRDTPSTAAPPWWWSPPAREWTASCSTQSVLSRRPLCCRTKGPASWFCAKHVVLRSWVTFSTLCSSVDRRVHPGRSGCEDQEARQDLQLEWGLREALWARCHGVPAEEEVPSGNTDVRAGVSAVVKYWYLYLYNSQPNRLYPVNLFPGTVQFY